MHGGLKRRGDQGTGVSGGTDDCILFSTSRCGVETSRNKCSGSSEKEEN